MLEETMHIESPWFTPEEIAQLRASFLHVIPRSDVLASRMYSDLFEKHPEVRPLFKTDLESQEAKLVHTLGALLDALDHPEMASEILAKMGDRHAKYGALPEHYPWVTESFLKVVAEIERGPEAEKTLPLWQRLLKFVENAMLSGHQ